MTNKSNTTNFDMRKYKYIVLDVQNMAYFVMIAATYINTATTATYKITNTKAV